MVWCWGILSRGLWAQNCSIGLDVVLKCGAWHLSSPWPTTSDTCCPETDNDTVLQARQKERFGVFWTENVAALPQELEFIIEYRKWSFSLNCQQCSFAATKVLVLKSKDISPLRLHIADGAARQLWTEKWTSASCSASGGILHMHWTTAESISPQGMCLLCPVEPSILFATIIISRSISWEVFLSSQIILHLLRILRNNTPFSQCSFLGYRIIRPLHSILRLSSTSERQLKVGVKYFQQ